MKTLQWLAAVVLVVAGIVLLMKPVRAHAEVRVGMQSVGR